MSWLERLAARLAAAWRAEPRRFGDEDPAGMGTALGLDAITAVESDHARSSGAPIVPASPFEPQAPHRRLV